MPERKQTKAPSTMAEAEIAIVRIAPETSFKNKAYEALKEAILKMDIYAAPEPVMLDERALSERLGVSRTPIREAIAMLEQDGFVKTVPRRGIVVVRRTKSEIVDMIRAWAALESMAARLITTTARKKDISALRDFFKDFGKDRLPQDHVEEYSKANIAFHQALISLSESPVLVDMTNDILLHVRGYRQLTIGRVDRTATSLPEHLAIIEALEERNTELAEKRARDHTLGLAAYVEAHGQELFEPALLLAEHELHTGRAKTTNSSTPRNDQGEAECPQQYRASTQPKPSASRPTASISSSMRSSSTTSIRSTGCRVFRSPISAAWRRPKAFACSRSATSRTPATRPRSRAS